MSDQTPSGVEIAESDLDTVNGGVLIGLLLPAVQKVREAAPPAGPHVRVLDGQTGG